MARTLGVNCTPACAYLALAVDGTVQPVPDRLEWPAGEDSERLVALLQDSQGLLKEQQISKLAMLLPGRGGKHQPGYFTVAPRVALETVIRLAAAMTDIPVAVLDRATVRARLGCEKTGALEEYLDSVIPAAIGQYWKAGRGLAAMAALAAERN